MDGTPQQTIYVNGRHTIRTDAPARLGGSDSGPSPQGLTPDQVARLRRVAETCPVKRALEAGFTFEQRIVLRPAAARPAI